MTERNLVMGEGPQPCVGMIVGEAPGAQEEREGRPFVGPSGALLNTALELANSSRERFYITNVYKYRPPGNRNPTDEEIAEHWDYFVDELTSVSPLVIMTLGNVPLGALTGQPGGITKRHGNLEKMYNTSGEPIDLLPVYHPSFVLRNRGRVHEEFDKDVETFVRMCETLTMNGVN